MRKDGQKDFTELKTASSRLTRGALILFQLKAPFTSDEIRLLVKDGCSTELIPSKSSVQSWFPVQHTQTQLSTKAEIDRSAAVVLGIQTGRIPGSGNDVFK